MELKVDFMESMKKSKRVIQGVTKEFARTFDRDYSGLIEQYRMDDAKYALIASGTLASTGKYVVNKLREEGEKVGMIRLRFFRPFPDQEIMEAASNLDAVGVLDRSTSMAPYGSTAMEVRSALYGNSKIPVAGFIAGLGGRDVKIDDFIEMFRMIKKGKEGNYYINAKGVK
jgi:pyruvate/2-oxoacid:ferredoxin oxidoreductase alpha subunit